MRRHGWAGNTPASDEEAMNRILDVVDSLAAQRATAISVTDVARSLGVSRQTVYRYFPGSEAMMAASRMRSADGFLERLREHMRGLHDPVAALVEGMAFTLEALVGDPQLEQVFEVRVDGIQAKPFTSEVATSFGRVLLRRYDVDWTGHGFDDAAFDDMVELCARTFHSLFIDPGRLLGDSAALRRFIAEWLGPAIHYRLMTRTVAGLGAIAATGGADTPRGKHKTA
ncbi:MAG TPA: TetR/AcrR family transcriptional regulator [Mycobacterium sp.]